jgi:hypothetical protein
MTFSVGFKTCVVFGVGRQRAGDVKNWKARVLYRVALQGLERARGQRKCQKKPSGSKFPLFALPYIAFVEAVYPGTSNIDNPSKAFIGTQGLCPAADAIARFEDEDSVSFAGEGSCSDGTGPTCPNDYDLCSTVCNSV